MRGTRPSSRMLPSSAPRGSVNWRLRRLASASTAFAAVMTMSLTAGPATHAAVADLCALPRSGAHHSVGLDRWNSGYPRPERTLDAVMVFLSFPDSAPRVRAAELAADYFPAAPRFFDRASYGRFRLRAHPVRRWIEMPAASDAYGIRRDWESGRRTTYLRDALRVADPAVDFSRYDIVYLVADPEAPGVDADATKVVNFAVPRKVDGASIRRVVTLFERRPPDRHVLAHETGHVFDLPDLYRRPKTSGVDWDSYVGDWDLMGSQFGLAPEPFGWHKWKLGWLDRARIVCLSKRGTTRHVLQPLEVPLRHDRGQRGPAGRPGGPAGDVRLLVAPLGSAEALAMELREPYGNDAALCTPGVLLYRVRSDVPSAQGPIRVIDTHPGTADCPDRSVHPRLADAPLGEGESHQLTVGGGMRVTAGARRASGGWTVTVTRG